MGASRGVFAKGSCWCRFDIVSEEIRFLFSLFSTVHRYRIQDTRYKTGHGRDLTQIAKRAGTTRPENIRRTVMDDEKLVGSASSPQTSPPSMTASSRTTFSHGGATTLGTRRKRQLYNPVDVVADLRHSNDHRAGSLLLVALVGIMVEWIVLTT